MKMRSPILQALAASYEASVAGRYGGGKRDVQADYEELLVLGKCAEGAAREVAESELRAARDAGLVKLDQIHRRDPRHFSKVRLSPANERRFFDYIGCESPTQRRAKWVALFCEAKAKEVPEQWLASWTEFCAIRAESARYWRKMEPFRVTQLARGKLLLEFTARLLAWKGRRLVRYASKELTGDSKLLEKWQGSLETLLAAATGDAVCDYESHGLLPMPRVATVHGPLRLHISGRIVDCAPLHGGTTISVEDLLRADAIECDAVRCLTVEGKAPFLEIAKHQSGELLVWTSFPNDATLALLRRLPRAMEFHHHGDTDPAGYDILHDLRFETGLPIRSLHMRYDIHDAIKPLTPLERARLSTLLKDESMAAEHANLAAMLAAKLKGDFEQERHREPPLPHWPFFTEA